MPDAINSNDPPEFYDVLDVEDPGFRRSEALSQTINAVLVQDDDHSMVRVAALAALVICYMRLAPQKHRKALTRSLVDDIRAQVDRA